MKKALFSLLLLWGSLLPAMAQQVTTFTLEECIAYAQAQSPEAIIAQKDLEIAAWQYRAFVADQKPQMGLRVNSPGLLRSINTITQPDGTQTFVQQNQAYSNAELYINQQIAPTGGTVFLSSGLNRLDVFGANGYILWQSAPLILGINQPIFAYNSFRFERRLQPLQYRLAEVRYLETLEEIAVDITGKFFDVFIAQLQINNAEQNLVVNDSVFVISQGRFRVGKIAENDLLQTELAFLNSRSQVQRAELNLARAKADLAITLGFSEGEEIAIIPPDQAALIEVDMELALSQARQNRSERIQQNIQTVQAESSVASAKAANRFQANLNASFGLNQSGNSFSEAYTAPLDRETFSIGFDIPILNWGKGKAVREAALAAQVRTQEQIKLSQRQLERDVRFQVLEFLQIQEQLLLSMKSDTIAARRFEVAKNRYLIGKIDITNFQIAQNEKNNARQSFISALRQYWVAYYQLRRATLYDWREMEPLSVPNLSNFPGGRPKSIR